MGIVGLTQLMYVFNGSLGLFHAGFAHDYRDESVESLLLMRCVLENPDNTVLYKTCSDLTKVRPSESTLYYQCSPFLYAVSLHVANEYIIIMFLQCYIWREKRISVEN